ncbi:MAG: GtrA family protein [Clostridia bacterium]|nr:GtrA family protein [Clostridia bacterium]MDO4836113.1 GtrA family protein [Clostridia bacterium]
MSVSEGKKSIVQLLKFVLIGASNTILDLLVTFALNAIFGIYYLAKIIGYACGIANSYFWNSRWTFREERKRDAREIVTFIAVNLVTLGLSLLLQWVFRDKLHLDAWWTGFAGENFLTKILNGDRFCLLLASGIALLVNFAGNKLLVFKKRETEPIEQTEE